MVLPAPLPLPPCLRPPHPRRLPPLQNPPGLLRPQRQPRRNSKRQLPAVKKFAALPSSEKSHAKIILTSPRFPAPAPAAASVRATFSAPSKGAVRPLQLLPAQQLRLLLPLPRALREF